MFCVLNLTNIICTIYFCTYKIKLFTSENINFKSRLTVKNLKRILKYLYFSSYLQCGAISIHNSNSSTFHINKFTLYRFTQIRLTYNYVQ